MVSAAYHVSPLRSLAASLLLTSAAFAGWQDDLGYTQLKNELGSSLPTGRGVSITMVEANSLTGDYAPSTIAFPDSGNFAGKAFSFQSGLPSGVSSHALSVASYITGSNTNPLTGIASVAPEAGLAAYASQITCFEAGHWLQQGSLQFGAGSLPLPGTSPIANHSWISYVGESLPAIVAQDVLRRADYQIHTSNVLAVVGLNNGANTAIPELMASAYNVLSVGLTDQSLTYNGHSTGVTPTTVDGPGRVKPEIVVPMSGQLFTTAATSYAAAITTSCAAFLMEVAQNNPSLQDATQSEVMRALLLTGARKSPIPTWTNTTTRPLDTHFGAGELNLRNSYYTLTAGAQPPTTPADPPRHFRGWAYQSSLDAGQTHTYVFAIPDGCVARELSATLVWNRQFPLAPLLVPALPNLDLRLYTAANGTPDTELTRSESGANGSVPHPLEHIYQHDVPAGHYAWQVVNAPISSFTTSYGLAWRAALAPAAAPELDTIWPTSGTALTLACTKLGTGLRYQVLASSDLHTWTSVATFTASGPTHTVTTISTPQRTYFRVVWLED